MCRAADSIALVGRRSRFSYTPAPRHAVCATGRCDWLTSLTRVRDAEMMLRRSFATLRSSQTHANLKAAFAGESQANRRYLYFAQKADVEGQPDVAAVFRSTAEGETGHAFGHLEFLAEAGDPATGEPIGNR